MRVASSMLRPAVLVMLAVSVLAASGCKWFRKGNSDYALSEEARPLEVPPDLNLPDTSAAMKLPPTASAQAAQPQSATHASGFNTTAGRDEAFANVGMALAAVEGVTIASKAQLLGSYDVSYEGSNFLVRVVGLTAGSYVSAVDPRGLPATDAAAVKLIAALKAKLAN